MRKASWAALGGLVGMLVVLSWSSRAQSQPKRTLGPLSAEVAKSSGLEEETVAKVLNALGPAAREQLAAGRSVALPGLGQMRVVRLSQRKDLVTGRPATLPATNSIEFIPDGTLDAAANAPGAIPAVEVDPFQYIPLPGQTPGQKIPSQINRSPSTRIR